MPKRGARRINNQLLVLVPFLLLPHRRKRRKKKPDTRRVRKKTAKLLPRTEPAKKRGMSSVQTVPGKVT